MDEEAKKMIELLNYFKYQAKCIEDNAVGILDHLSRINNTLNCTLKRIMEEAAKEDG